MQRLREKFVIFANNVFRSNDSYKGFAVIKSLFNNEDNR